VSDLHQGDFAVIEGVAFEEVFVEDLLTVLMVVGIAREGFAEGFLMAFPIAKATVLVMVLGVATAGAAGLVAVAQVFFAKGDPTGVGAGAATVMTLLVGEAILRAL